MQTYLHFQYQITLVYSKLELKSWVQKAQISSYRSHYMSMNITMIMPPLLRMQPMNA